MTISDLSEPDNSIEIHETGVSSTELKRTKQKSWTEILIPSLNNGYNNWREIEEEY